jgi:hypothetical protein
VLSSIVEERKQTLNDRVLVNCSMALGFLSAFSSDPAEMKALFHAYDGAHSDPRISLGVKLGVLMNGSDKLPGADSLGKEAAAHISLLLSTKSGVVEIDGKDLKVGRPDEEIFRFDGALDALGHIMNTFLRRLYTSEAVIGRSLFKAVTESGIFQKLNEEEDFSAMSEVYRQIPGFIAVLPLPPLGSKHAISAEMAQVMRDSFTFLHRFYLDFERKSDGRPALLNLLQLTFNNGLDLGVSTTAEEITPLSARYIRDTVCEAPSLTGIIPQDMKMVCADIVFAQD